MNKVSIDEGVRRAQRLNELRDYFYSKYGCDIISGWNTLALYRNYKDYSRSLTFERFKATAEEWEMYQEARALKVLLSVVQKIS